MAIVEHSSPYEFLVRWNPDGTISGAHIGFRTQLIKDGVVVLESADPVKAVALADTEGFPLGDILGVTQIAALKTIEAKQLEIEQLKKDHEAQLLTSEANAKAQIEALRVESQSALDSIVETARVREEAQNATIANYAATIARIREVGVALSAVHSDQAG